MRQASSLADQRCFGVRSSTVGGIVLAAGGSSRMGKPKQLLEYRGRNLLRHAAEVAVASGVGPIVIVLGAQADRLVGELAGLRVQHIINADWQSGIGGSIRTGIRALPEVEAVVIILCDQPLTGPDIIARLVDAYRVSGSPIVASEYQGTVGVPALFARPYFQHLTKLADGAGAKSVIAQAGAIVQTVPFSGGAVDIDTPHEYERLLGLRA